jgi:hypothetical protein
VMQHAGSQQPKSTTSTIFKTRRKATTVRQPSGPTPGEGSRGRVKKNRTC